MRQPGFIWKFYALYWTVISFRANLEIFSPGSPAYAFYHILGAFHAAFIFIYFFDIIGKTLNVISLVPLYGYVFQKKFFTMDLWKIVFLLRAAFDVFGNYYAFVTIKSFFATDPWLGFQILAGILLTAIPSYAACYYYAFRGVK